MSVGGGVNPPTWSPTPPFREDLTKGCGDYCVIFISVSVVVALILVCISFCCAALQKRGGISGASVERVPQAEDDTRPLGRAHAALALVELLGACFMLSAVLAGAEALPWTSAGEPGACELLLSPTDLVVECPDKSGCDWDVQLILRAALDGCADAPAGRKSYALDCSSANACDPFAATSSARVVGLISGLVLCPIGLGWLSLVLGKWRAARAETAFAMLAMAAGAADVLAGVVWYQDVCSDDECVGSDGSADDCRRGCYTAVCDAGCQLSIAGGALCFLAALTHLVALWWSRRRRVYNAVATYLYLAPATVGDYLPPSVASQPTFRVEVPPDGGPGATVRVTAPNGVPLDVTIPLGAAPGGSFEVAMPGSIESAPTAAAIELAPLPDQSGKAIAKA